MIDDAEMQARLDRTLKQLAEDDLEEIARKGGLGPCVTVGQTAPGRRDGFNIPGWDLA